LTATSRWTIEAEAIVVVEVDAVHESVLFESRRAAGDRGLAAQRPPDTQGTIVPRAVVGEAEIRLDLADAGQGAQLDGVACVTALGDHELAIRCADRVTTQASTALTVVATATVVGAGIRQIRRAVAFEPLRDRIGLFRLRHAPPAGIPWASRRHRQHQPHQHGKTPGPDRERRKTPVPNARQNFAEHELILPASPIHSVKCGAPGGTQRAANADRRPGDG
jgi:hypothetical protein